MNLISEFTVISYASNGGFDEITWRWLPHDSRSQPLYADGYLPAAERAEFESLCDLAEVWVDGDDVYTVGPPETATLATSAQKRSMLDGFLWVARTGTIYGLAEDHPDKWAAHQHLPPDGVTLVPKAEWEAIREAIALAAVEAQIPANAQLVFDEAGAAYDAKVARYKILGWTDADCLAEFGPRPSSATV